MLVIFVIVKIITYLCTIGVEMESTDARLALQSGTAKATALNGAKSDLSNAGYARTCAVVELNQEGKVASLAA